MIDLPSYLERILASKTLEDVWSFHTEAMAAFGFDRLIYGLTRFKSGSNLGSPDDFLVLSNHNACYVNQFVHGGLYLSSPMIRWAVANSGACSWRWIEDNYEDLTPAEKKVVAFNKENGVTAGYSMSFPGASHRAHGVIALTGAPGLSQSDVDQIWKTHGRDIAMMNDVAHLKIIALPHAPAHPLTDRQREVLEWVGDGKTVQDIATILSVTPATIEKHLRMARERLDVATTAQAVLKAGVQHQIYVLR